jgi:hypothetical protein
VGRIGRVRSDGTRGIVASDLADPGGVAADDTYVYWSTQLADGGRIMRMRR